MRVSWRLEQMDRSANNFGVLRLCFAVLVILSHSFELIDGDRSREPLTRLFGVMSFGGLGVYGFFLISGYLITKSFIRSKSSIEFLYKRILRIYPGFIAAYLICIFVLGPFVGGELQSLSVLRTITRVFFLQPPIMDGVFPNSYYAALNGSMWTIAYEFRCYLFVLALGVLGLLHKRNIILLMTAMFLFLTVLHPAIFDYFPRQLVLFLGDPFETVPLVSVFGVGALFYLYRDYVIYDWRLAVAASASLFCSMYSASFAVAAFAVFGGYLVFWIAFNVKSSMLNNIGKKVDLSYGIYLYAWPVQKVLIWWRGDLSPWVVFLGSTMIAAVFALMSWRLVEKPFLDLKSAFVFPRKAICKEASALPVD